jgi:D-beta-D-heptose 7-phosphate kinase/D-beta-D-heptose 1-phosphate adenosyltransferase
MTRKRLGELLDGFGKCRVAILGDMMLDRYVWGDVNRISPEAPVPVVEVSRETVRFGGAANVAENVASLGASAIVVGVVGRDENAHLLTSFLTERGVDISKVLDVDGRPTTTKTRIIAHSQQVVRADREDTRSLSADTESRLIELATEAIESADVLVISDYGKGVVSERTLAAVLERVHEAGKPVCVDPKESHFGSYTGVTAITPNQKETAGAVEFGIRGEEDLLRAGWELRKRLDAECVIITRGEEGMSLFMRDSEHIHLPTMAREVFDVTGAGDTVVGVLAVALAAGATMVEAAVVANHAAGMVIREIGTASVTTEEIARSFEDIEED